MRKIIALLLALSMMFALCGCVSNVEAEPEKVEAEAEKEEIAVEKQYDVVVEDCAVAWEASSYIAISPKVHNCTDMDAAFLLVNCELIDKDGRTIRVAKCDTGGVAAGANEWVSGIIQVPYDEVEKIAELKFSGGSFDISKDGKCYRQTVSFAETSFTSEHVFGK